MSRTFASLSVRNYRRWFFANIVANTGGWMQRIAQDWVVLKILTNGSGWHVGIVTALQFLPQLLLGPWAGVLADRLDRRKMMLVTQTVMLALSVGLGTLVLTGLVQMWMVYAFAFALGVAAALDSPPRTIFVSELVEQRLLPNAVSLNSVAFNSARMIGPAVAGIVIAWVGPGWVFMVNALAFLAPIVTLASIRPHTLNQVERVKRAKGQIREGIRYVKNRTDLQMIMLVAGVVSAFGLNFGVTVGVMATRVFGLDAADFGLLNSAMAVGSLGGALFSARNPQPRVRSVIGAAFAFGIAATTCALAPTVWLFAITLVGCGFCSLLMITSANSTMQLSTTPQMRGRVMSLYVMIFLGVTPVGSPLVGWIADNVSPRWSIGVGAIASVLVALYATWWTWRHWDIHFSYNRHLPFIHAQGPRERAALEASLREAAALESAEETTENKNGENPVEEKPDPAQ